jgi:hypothetical protein
MFARHIATLQARQPTPAPAVFLAIPKTQEMPLPFLQKLANQGGTFTLAFAPDRAGELKEPFGKRLHKAKAIALL